MNAAVDYDWSNCHETHTGIVSGEELGVYMVMDASPHGRLLRSNKTISQRVFAKSISNEPASDSVLLLAAGWLKECVERHTCHQLTQPPVLPTRVIDVGTRQSDTVHLVETDGKEGNYLALTYCWGPGPHPHKLTKRKFEAWKEHIPSDLLPKTIADAIHLTRHLEIPYLWVDALCIIQDDSRDWQKESSKMSDVYSNAYCTISTTGSQDYTMGCFLERTALSVPARPCKLYMDKSNAGPILVPNVPDWDTGVLHAPLNWRAWTLQERVLSHRILHWTKHELFWECRQKRASESWPLSYISSADNGKIPPKDTVLKRSESTNYSRPGETPVAFLEITPANVILKRSCVIASEVSRRNITIDSDILLPALSGLAKVIHQRINDRYMAGMWLCDLPRSLFWTTQPYLPPIRRSKSRPENYRAPS
ncbi:heterokaryon incompatibility protein-domain-containing protein [Xylogone sp. PMI_703]|nr:heterokaryon incompatibility protein-domain-containing protein [Xylogone sp. PMI_703]